MATDDWREFWDLIKDIKFGMFTAFSTDGRLHSRPMTTQNREDDGHNKLWFFMSRNSEPVLDLARDPNVNVAYADPGLGAYVSVAGYATVFDDVQTKKALWSTTAQLGFPVVPKTRRSPWSLSRSSRSSIGRLRAARWCSSSSMDGLKYEGMQHSRAAGSARWRSPFRP